jgi:16S rRNA processing protein RimM
VDFSAWVVVGRLLRSRGRVGEFVAEIDSDHPGRAERLQTVLLRKGPLEKLTQVARLWYHDERPILQFAGIDSISAAEPWEGAEILVAPEDRIQPEAGEYLYEDLIGCSVEENGRVLGTIESVEELGGPPMLVLRTLEGRELLIPFARAICREIDVAHRLIRVELPEGLEKLR